MTTISGGGSVVVFNAGENDESILNGFTITGGSGVDGKQLSIEKSICYN